MHKGVLTNRRASTKVTPTILCIEEDNIASFSCNIKMNAWSPISRTVQVLLPLQKRPIELTLTAPFLGPPSDELLKDDGYGTVRVRLGDRKT